MTPVIRLAVTMLLLACSLASAAVYFDFGTPESAVYEGFTRVTQKDAFAPGQTAFGWQTAEGMTTQAKVQAGRAENKSRGTTEPPPILTNALTEDTIIGDKPNTFLFTAAPGPWHVCVFSGLSDRFPYQVFDFTIAVGRTEKRVILNGGYHFEETLFTATVTDQPVAVRFTPRSRWLATGLLAWPDSEDAQVRSKVLGPLEQSIYQLPPEEWKLWQEEPHVDHTPFPEVEAITYVPYLLHRRSYLEPVYPKTIPLQHTLNPTLRAFATRGEYEPLTFTVWAVRALKNARVSVPDLKSGSSTIPAREIDVRHVVYTLCRTNYSASGIFRNNPDWLEHFTALDLAPNMNHTFWLTVHVPENAAGGIYQGEATFRADGVPAGRVPIVFRVLPITLQEDPEKIYGIYYRHPLDYANNAKDDVSREYYRRQAELEAQDMVAHGMRNITLSMWCRGADDQGKFDFKPDVLQAELDLAKEHGFKPPYIVAVNTGAVYYKYMKESFGSHLRNLKQPPPEFAAELTAMVKYLDGIRRERGWPEFLWYPIDEPSSDPASVQFMVTVLKAVRDAGVRTYVTADPTVPGFEPMRPYVDVWCTQPFAPDRETVLADTKARGVEYWCYPNHVSGENDHTPLAGARMTYGFGFWRSGFRTLIPWIYTADVGDLFNYLDGPMMDFMIRHEPDGTPIPVALWECFREGYDDYRYVYTLKQAMEDARQSGNAQKRRDAEAAQKDLEYVWKAIQVQPKYKYDGLWGYDEFDAYRWLLAQHLLRLVARVG